MDGLDWRMFIAGNQADLSGLTWKDSYLRGDLDGDNDIHDFAKFRGAYELSRPAPGAFAAMVAAESVPEPGSMLLLAAGGLALLLRGFVGSRGLSQFLCRQERDCPLPRKTGQSHYC